MSDQFAHLDGAYVLDALEPDEHARFETHLRGCPECADRVAELTAVSRRLAAVSLDDVLTDLDAEDAGPVPDTVLPRLVREVRTRRRRRTVVVAGLVAIAACVAALVAVLVTRGPAPARTPVAAGIPMTQVIPTSVHARVELVSRESGTRVVLHCRYDAHAGPRIEYAMRLVDRTGRPHQLTHWYIGPGENLTFAATSPLPKADIARVEVTLDDGRAILRLQR